MVDGTLKSNYYYCCTRLFCMALVEQLGDDDDELMLNVLRCHLTY